MKDLIYTDSNFLKIDINKIIKLEYFLIRRILILSVKLYTKVTFINEQINNIIKMLFSSNPSATIEINNYNFNRIYNWLYIYEKKDKIQINKLSLDFIKQNKKYKITIIDKLLILDIIIKNNIHLNPYYNNRYDNKNIFYLDYDKIDISTFYLRTRTPNDKIYLDDYYGYRKLKNIFINKKIPKIYRDLIPILVDQNNIICCLFVGTNKNYNVTCKTKKILILKFRSNLYNGIFC